MRSLLAKRARASKEGAIWGRWLRFWSGALCIAKDVIVVVVVEGEVDVRGHASENQDASGFFKIFTASD